MGLPFPEAGASATEPAVDSVLSLACSQGSAQALRIRALNSIPPTADCGLRQGLKVTASMTQGHGRFPKSTASPPRGDTWKQVSPDSDPHGLHGSLDLAVKHAAGVPGSQGRCFSGWG